MKCKICAAETRKVFSAVVLAKYQAEYSLCPNCGFLSVDEPFWLKEAYKNPINITDTGILQCNIGLADKTAVIIAVFYDKNLKFVDFAGGYMIFTRLMRDIGFEFYWHDPYTANLFARGFEFKEARGIELLTTFESFEHFVSPAYELEKMLSITGDILFSTTILPDPVPAADKWWYYGLEHGQHVSFYSIAALRKLADRYGLNFYTNGLDLHLFTKKNLNQTLFRLLSRYGCGTLRRMLCRKMSSRTLSDMNFLADKENRLR